MMLKEPTQRGACGLMDISRRKEKLQNERT